MSKQVWVKVISPSRYSEPDEQWCLGTVVGVQQVRRYHERPSMAQQLSGEMFWIENRYLVETKTGVVEAWESNCYDQAPEASSSSNGLEGQTGTAANPKSKEEQ